MFSAAAPYASAQSNAALPDHIIINQIYGGGETNDARDMEVPVSHAFVELYNPTDEAVCIDGWSLQYAARGDRWQVFTLGGSIGAHSSFLVRCRAYNANARLKIDKFDASWDIGINNKGCKVLLKSSAKAAKTANPYRNEKTDYVDMAGIAGNRFFYSVDGCETDFPQIQSKQKALRRKNFADTDNNAKDFVAIDYRTADITEVGPHSSADGEWTNTEYVRSKKITPVPLDTSAAKSEFSFLHVSDTQASTRSQFAQWGRLTELLNDEDYDFTVHTGDLTDNADNTAEMDMFYDNSGAVMQKPFIPVVGNHDQKSSTKAKLFSEYFGTLPGSEAPCPVPGGTTASFDYGNAHFVILNTESDLTVQKQWLGEELAKTDKKWKIVAMHRSPYGAVGVNDTVAFASVFDKYHVDLVIHGHDHLYLRSKPLYNGKPTEGGTVYLESGSSGVKQENGIAKQSYDEVCISPKSPTFSKITVSDGAIKVSAKCIGEDGALGEIDSFEIKKYSGTYSEVVQKTYETVSRNFADVKPGCEYGDAITLLAELGIVDKTPLFGGSDAIDYETFAAWLNRADGTQTAIDTDDGELTVKSAVGIILGRLGYAPYIEQSNSDETAVAKSIGLYNNIDGDSNRLTKYIAAQLIANALEAYTIKLDSITGEYANYGQAYTDWLGDVHGVYKIRGIIRNRPYYRRDSSKNQVEFDTEYGETISVKCSDNVYSFLGYEIDAYIYEPYSNGKMLCAAETKNNNVLQIKKSDYGDVTSVGDYINFSYTDNSKNRNVKISKTAEFVYNGAVSDIIGQKALRAEHNAFKPSHIGSIKLVDCNRDGVYDFVFIDNYKDMYVSGIDRERCKITNELEYTDGVSVKKSKYNEISSICLDAADDSYRVSFLTPDEEPTAFSAITPGSVVSVALSSTDDESADSALVRRVYVSNQSARGTVTSVFEDEGDDYFVIDGKAYRASKSYYNTYNGGESVNYPIGVGDNMALYLDYDGRFAYAENETKRTQTGILINTADGDTFGTYRKLRIINSLGETVDCKMETKVYDKLALGSVNLPVLAEFRMNGEYVYNVDFDMNFREYGNFLHMKNTNRLGNYFLSSETTVFLYRGEKNDSNTADADLYYVISPDYLKDRRTYSADIYAAETKYTPQTAVVYDSGAKLGIDDSVMVVTALKRTADKKGDDVYRITGYSHGETVAVYLPTDIGGAVECGDVVQYALNPDGRIGKLKIICDYDTADFDINGFADDISLAKCNTVDSVSGGIISTVKSGVRVNYYTNADTVVYNIVKSARTGVTIGDADDITDDNKVFIIMKEGIADEIFVWKDE